MMKQTAALKESINHNYYNDLLLISIVALVTSGPNTDCCSIWVD